MIEIVNLLPNDVTVESVDGVIVTFPANMDATCPYIELDTVFEYGELGEFSCRLVQPGRVMNLPVKKNNVYYIVTRFIFEMVDYRADLIAPDVTNRDTVRDGNKIVSVPGFLCRDEDVYQSHN